MIHLWITLTETKNKSLMGQLQKLDEKIAALKSVNEVFSLPDVKDRYIKNYEAATGRKDGENRMEQERFAYLQILQEKPDLQKVDKLWHFMALVYSATTGCSFRDNKLYVIPTGNGKLKVQTSPSAKREMLERMANVKRVPETVLVMNGDTFVVDKLNGIVKQHETTPKSAEKITLENIRAAYQRIYFKDNSIVDVIIYHDEFVKAKSKSKVANGGPWVDWPGEMCKKTTLNRAFRLYHKYPDNVVLYGSVDEEETQDVNHTDYESEYSEHPDDVSKREIVDEETGEITPTEEVTTKEPKKKSEAGEQQSFM